MQIVETLQISGRGLVVITDIKVCEVAVLGINLRAGMPISFTTSTGKQIWSTFRSLELFSSPFNPNKPFAFVVENNISEADLPPRTQVAFIPSAI